MMTDLARPIGWETLYALGARDRFFGDAVTANLGHEYAWRSSAQSSAIPRAIPPFGGYAPDKKQTTFLAPEHHDPFGPATQAGQWIADIEPEPLALRNAPWS
jgi:hypothetical protein